MCSGRVEQRCQSVCRVQLFLTGLTHHINSSEGCVFGADCVTPSDGPQLCDFTTTCHSLEEEHGVGGIVMWP